MSSTPQQYSGPVILKISKRGTRRLKRLGVPVLSLANNFQLEMEEQQEPRTRGQKRMYPHPLGAVAAAPNYFESSLSSSPPPKKRLVKRRRFFVDDDEEDDEEKSEAKRPSTPTSTVPFERTGSGVVHASDAPKAEAKTSHTTSTAKATPKATPTPKARSTPTPTPAFGSTSARYAFLNISTHAGEKANILVEESVLERIPTYSQKLTAAKKAQTPGTRLSIVDSTKRDIEELTVIFEYLRFGTLPTIKPTLQSIRQIRSLATVASILKLDMLIANLVHRLTNLDVPDTLTFVAVAAEIFRTTSTSAYDFSANNTLRVWAEQYIRGDLELLEDEGGLKLLRRQEGVLREIFVDVLLERWRWGMMMQGAL